MGLRKTSTPGPWLQHPKYPTCLAAVADLSMSLLTIEHDGYGAFLHADDCKLAAAAPDLAKAMKRLLDSDNASAQFNDDQLRIFATDPRADAIVHEQAASILEAREALRKAGVA
jgi:hypothetical protein